MRNEGVHDDRAEDVRVRCSNLARQHWAAESVATRKHPAVPAPARGLGSMSPRWRSYTAGCTGPVILDTAMTPSADAGHLAAARLPGQPFVGRYRPELSRHSLQVAWSAVVVALIAGMAGSRHAVRDRSPTSRCTTFAPGRSVVIAHLRRRSGSGSRIRLSDLGNARGGWFRTRLTAARSES